MSKFDLLKEQHKDIASIVNTLKDFINKNNFEADGLEIAKTINLLSGRLTVHLKHEDDYLYPELLKSENASTRALAEKFSKEMGGLASTFMTYKSNFNTRGKIVENKEAFRENTLVIIKALEERLRKEDTQLYVSR